MRPHRAAATGDVALLQDKAAPGSEHGNVLALSGGYVRLECVSSCEGVHRVEFDVSNKTTAAS